MKSKVARLALAAIAISLPFAACDDDTSEFPVGVYHQPGSTDSDGTMEFESDGTWVGLGPDGLMFADGTYSVDGDEFTFETDSYCKQVSDAAESATYMWTVDGDLLTMSLEGEDLCTDRLELVESGFEKSDS